MAPPYRPSLYRGLPLHPGVNAANPMDVGAGAAGPAGMPVEQTPHLRPSTRLGAPTPKPPKVAKAPVRAGSLPATSGKTTVPTRTVAATPAAPPVKAKPPVAAKPAKAAKPAAARPAARRAPAPAGPAPLTPGQYAQQQVDAALAPLYTQAQTQADRQNHAITAYTQAIMQQLQGVAPQVQGDYNNAINAQSALVNSAADSLRSANPNQQDQQLLQAIGAPDAQQQQLSSQLANTFNGGAAVGQYVSGVSPLGALRSQGLTAASLARLQPGFEALRGSQALQSALAQQSDANAKIAGQRPQLVNQYQNAYAAQQQKQQQLGLEAQALGLKVNNQQFTQSLDASKFKLDVAKAQTAVDKYNAQQTAAGSKIDVQVSKGFGDGFAHNAQGQVIADKSGRPLQFRANGTVQAKTPSGTQVAKLVDEWKNGKVQNVNVQQPNPDANGNPVYKSVSAQTGKLNFGQAYRRLRAMGVVDKTARQYLQTAYKRGEQGRGWLTNEEQSALGRARLAPRARTIRGHGVITTAQYKALRKAGIAPPGTLTTGGFVISQVY